MSAICCGKVVNTLSNNCAGKVIMRGIWMRSHCHTCPHCPTQLADERPGSPSRQVPARHFYQSPPLAGCGRVGQHVQGTDVWIKSARTPVVPRSKSRGVTQFMTWWYCNDAIALVGYATLMMTRKTHPVIFGKACTSCCQIECFIRGVGFYPGSLWCSALDHCGTAYSSPQRP